MFGFLVFLCKCYIFSSFAFLVFCKLFVRLIETALYVWLLTEFLTFSQHVGPRSGPSFTLRAAPAHLPSQELRWDLLICFPPPPIKFAANVHVSFS